MLLSMLQHLASISYIITFNINLQQYSRSRAISTSKVNLTAHCIEIILMMPCNYQPAANIHDSIRVFITEKTFYLAEIMGMLA